MKTDEKIFGGLKYFGEDNAKRNVPVECIVGLKNALPKVTSSTLLIIDEADHELLDNGSITL